MTIGAIHHTLLIHKNCPNSLIIDSLPIKCLLIKYDYTDYLFFNLRNLLSNRCNHFLELPLVAYLLIKNILALHPIGCVLRMHPLP